MMVTTTSEDWAILLPRSITLAPKVTVEASSNPGVIKVNVKGESLSTETALPAISNSTVNSGAPVTSTATGNSSPSVTSAPFVGEIISIVGSKLMAKSISTICSPPSPQAR